MTITTFCCDKTITNADIFKIKYWTLNYTLVWADTEISLLNFVPRVLSPRGRGPENEVVLSSRARAQFFLRAREKRVKFETSDVALQTSVTLCDWLLVQLKNSRTQVTMTIVVIVM